MKVSIPIRWMTLLVVFCLLSACSSSRANPTESLTQTLFPTALPAISTSTQAAKLPMSTSTQPSPTLQSKDTPSNPPEAPTTTASAQFQGPLSVVLTDITDDTVVQNAILQLHGQADPETVISFDDQIVYVGQQRTFSLSLTLVEGPNLIEITASDLTGSTASVYLTVTYEPQP